MSLKADCIFCRIIAREVPAKVVFENESCICIQDLYPQAPVHLLVIPKKHVRNIMDSDTESWNGVLTTVKEVATSQGLMPGGFRSILNTESGGGQTVFHMHMHLMGGKALGGKLV